MSTGDRLPAAPVRLSAGQVPAARAGVQTTIDELGTPLHEVTFVVVDLETTGGCAEDGGDHRDRRRQGPRR